MKEFYDKEVGAVDIETHAVLKSAVVAIYVG